MPNAIKITHIQHPQYSTHNAATQMQYPQMQYPQMQYPQMQYPQMQYPFTSCQEVVPHSLPPPGHRRCPLHPGSSCKRPLVLPAASPQQWQTSGTLDHLRSSEWGCGYSRWSKAEFEESGSHHSGGLTLAN